MTATIKNPSGSSNEKYFFTLMLILSIILIWIHYTNTKRNKKYNRNIYRITVLDKFGITKYPNDVLLDKINKINNQLLNFYHTTRFIHSCKIHKHIINTRQNIIKYIQKNKNIKNTIYSPDNTDNNLLNRKLYNWYELNCDDINLNVNRKILIDLILHLEILSKMIEKASCHTGVIDLTQLDDLVKLLQNKLSNDISKLIQDIPNNDYKKSQYISSYVNKHMHVDDMNNRLGKLNNVSEYYHNMPSKYIRDQTSHKYKNIFKPNENRTSIKFLLNDSMNTNIPVQYLNTTTNDRHKHTKDTLLDSYPSLQK